MTGNSSRVERTIAALQRHGFEAVYFAQRGPALAWLAAQVKPGDSVGLGGSLTLQQLGVDELLRAKGAEVLWHWQPGLNLEQQREIYYRCLRAELYLCSANAISEDGCILNVDGRGNRVAASIFGPQRVCIVAGVNKLVPDVDAAYKRVEQIAAPRNCELKGMDTPCAKTGVCADCTGDSRSCRVYVLMKRPPRITPICVALIDEELGL